MTHVFFLLPYINPNPQEWHIKLKKGLFQSEKTQIQAMRQHFIPNKLSKIKILEKYVDYFILLTCQLFHVDIFQYEDVVNYNLSLYISDIAE